MGGVLNIPIDAGTTRRVSFTVTLDEDPVDFTGSTVTFTSEHTDKELELDGGVLTLELTPQETARMYGGKYVIDVEWPSGDIFRLLAGFLLVSRPPKVATP